MSVETIIRHTCDQCGKQQDETRSNFLPCGGSDSWSSWEIKKNGTASHMYGANDNKEFCCFDCAIDWMQRLKTHSRNFTKNRITESLRELFEAINIAIKIGDWKVDGRCDPDSALFRAESILIECGYRQDELTNEEIFYE